MVKEDIINKISKLLAKTEQAGATPEEASASIALAHKLMAKYGVEMGDLNVEEEEIVCEDMSVGTKSVSNMQAHLAKALADHFGCEIFLHGSSKGQTIRVVGEKDKVVVYMATFMFAYNVFKKSWEKYKRTLDCDVSRKNLIRGTYFRGFVDGITNELVKQENQFGLIVLKSEKLLEYMNNIKFNGNKKASVKTMSDMKAYTQGYLEGSSAQLQKHKALD